MGQIGPDITPDELKKQYVNTLRLLAKATRERDYAIDQWLRLENATDIRIKHGYREQWTKEELLKECEWAEK